MAPLAVSVMDSLRQIVGFAGKIDNTGSGFTVTLIVCVLVQPLALVPVIVYVVVAIGLALTCDPVLWFKPALGDHVYVLAPFMFKVTLSPMQRVALDGVALKVGKGFTATVLLIVLLQPLASVPVMVYVVVEVGLAVTVVPVV